MTIRTVEQAVIGNYQEAARQLSQSADETSVHAYRVAARRLQSLLALWRPLIHSPSLERRLARAIARLSALRDAQVHALKFGGAAPASEPIKAPLFEPALMTWWQQREEWGSQPLLGPLYAMVLGQRLLILLDRDGVWPLRHWHRLRLVIKEARYGIELLVAEGMASHSWLSELSEWQELLGQLQDRRQWLRRLPSERLAAEEESARTVLLEAQIQERLQLLVRRRPVLRELAITLLRSGPAR